MRHRAAKIVGVNIFDANYAAELYARGRPYHQDVVIQRIAAQLDIDHRLDRALDVACGTGLSCIALKQVAEKIVAVDTSAEMLGQANRHEHIDYLRCPSQVLALGDGSFDLITVSSAFHWFDREAFLPEAHRVLKSRGWLVIYNNLFFATMKGNADFKPWTTSTYVKRFPTPPRNNQPLDDQTADRSGFQRVKHESYTNVVFFNRQQLIDYLLTQTNVIAAIERGESTLHDARAYLAAEVSPFFTSSEQQAFDFGGPITYLRKAG